MRQGFSLVELSIVLVILGLLTGGILTGQSLIRAAELKSVSTQLSKIQTAAYSFRDKYFALPGDMPNATRFWGAVGGGGTGAACFGVASNGTLTCDGTGDGIIRWPAGSTGNWNMGERYHAWVQLSNAGLIEGSYTGVSDDPTNANTNVPGKNVLAGKISNTFFTLVYQDIGSTSYFAHKAGNVVIFSINGANPLTPEEAWNIDTKLDDGRPASGTVISNSSTGSVCTTTLVMATALYNLQNTTQVCSLSMYAL